MSLPSSQRRILMTIENELQADPELAATFLAFAHGARQAAMPATEQLAAREWRRFWRPASAFLDRLKNLVPSACSRIGVRPRSHASTKLSPG